MINRGSTVIIHEEHVLAVVSSLRDMVREGGDNEACVAGHAESIVCS